jgi:hypothetical protein
MSASSIHKSILGSLVLAVGILLPIQHATARIADDLATGDTAFNSLCSRDFEPDPACRCLGAHVRRTLSPRLYAGAATVTVSIALASFYGDNNRERMARAMRTAERSLVESQRYSTADIAAIRRALGDGRKSCQPR